MLGLRRSSIEIIYDMLNLCHPDGINKTAIMYRTNLSHDQLGKYLAFLQANNLLQHRENYRFVTTERGMNVMQQVGELLTMLRDLNSDAA